MSQPTTKIDGPAKGKSSSSKLWIALSFLLSACVLGWAFSLPFRHPGQPLASSAKTDLAAGQLQSSEQIRQRRTNAEEFRAAAIALDREFMRSLAQKREAKPKVPGAREARLSWNRHVEKVNEQVEQLKNAPKGSLEAAYREKLLESLDDGPG